MSNSRDIGLAELRAVLNEVLAEIEGLDPVSPDRDEVAQERYQQILGAVLALDEELREG